MSTSSFFVDFTNNFIERDFGSTLSIAEVVKSATERETLIFKRYDVIKDFIEYRNAIILFELMNFYNINYMKVDYKVEVIIIQGDGRVQL